MMAKVIRGFESLFLRHFPARPRLAVAGRSIRLSGPDVRLVLKAPAVALKIRFPMLIVGHECVPHCRQQSIAPSTHPEATLGTTV